MTDATWIALGSRGCVEQGKAAKDRDAMLSPVVPQRLRTRWRVGHAQGKMLPGDWPHPALRAAGQRLP
jgi:hypothetical protein